MHLQIIAALAEGKHPLTGETLADESVLQLPAVIRALHTAHAALATAPTMGQPLPTPLPTPLPMHQAPPNAGLPWLPSEDDVLTRMHTQGKSIKEMAAALGRTRFGVEIRLDKLELRRLPQPAPMLPDPIPQPRKN